MYNGGTQCFLWCCCNSPETYKRELFLISLLALYISSNFTHRCAYCSDFTLICIYSIIYPRYAHKGMIHVCKYTCRTHKLLCIVNSNILREFWPNEGFSLHMLTDLFVYSLLNNVQPFVIVILYQINIVLKTRLCKSFQCMVTINRKTITSFVVHKK